MPMEPLAPGTLRMTMGWPQAACRCGWIDRDITSAAAPAAKGTNGERIPDHIWGADGAIQQGELILHFAYSEYHKGQKDQGRKRAKAQLAPFMENNKIADMGDLGHVKTTSVTSHITEPDKGRK